MTLAHSGTRDVEALLTSLIALGRIIEDAKLAQAKQWETSAPLFTPFDYLRKDEYGVSRVIADLLDPNGPHSQGPLFLRLFLEMLRRLR